MPANRRKRRQKVRPCTASAYFALQVTGIPLDAESFHGAVTKALEEAYGEVGGARYEFSVEPVASEDVNIDIVLHVPHVEQRGKVWAALTLMYEYGAQCVRIVVTRTADTVEGLSATNYADEDVGNVGNTEKVDALKTEMISK